MNGTDLYFLAEWTEHMIYKYSNDYKFTMRKKTDHLTIWPIENVFFKGFRRLWQGEKMFEGKPRIVSKIESAAPEGMVRWSDGQLF